MFEDLTLSISNTLFHSAPPADCMLNLSTRAGGGGENAEVGELRQFDKLATTARLHLRRQE